MKKYRLFAAAMLLVLPTMLFSTAGQSKSRLPQIGVSTQPLAQQSCPTGSGQGCFGSVTGPAGSSMMGLVFAASDQFRRESVNTCSQFVRQLMRLGAEPG